MDSVAANNKTLSASRQYSEAQKLNAKTGIYLANPSVTFDRLNNASGNYSEMVVSQSFDFPSAYVHKSKIANLSASQFEELYRQSKLEIFTSTVQVYTELVSINRIISILSERRQMALQLQSGIEKRLSAGDANIFEANRVRSELAKVQSELQLAESRQKSLRLKLSALNGGKYIAVTDTVFPILSGFVVSDSSVNALSATHPQVKKWEDEALIAQRNILLQRSLSFPKFEIGYRQDMNTGQTYSGFHAGITIPLFENKNTVQSAKARQIYASEGVNAYKLELQSNVSQLIEEYNAVQLSVSSMNEVFKTLNTPELLLKAYKAGQINYTEFFSEYENYQQTALYVEELNQKAASLLLQLYVMSGV
jgi:outer membrane protein TolC